MSTQFNAYRVPLSFFLAVPWFTVLFRMYGSNSGRAGSAVCRADAGSALAQATRHCAYRGVRAPAGRSCTPYYPLLLRICCLCSSPLLFKRRCGAVASLGWFMPRSIVVNENPIALALCIRRYHELPAKKRPSSSLILPACWHHSVFAAFGSSPATHLTTPFITSAERHTTYNRWVLVERRLLCYRGYRAHTYHL